MQCRCCLAQCPIHPLTDELPFFFFFFLYPPIESRVKRRPCSGSCQISCSSPIGGIRSSVRLSPGTSLSSSSYKKKSFLLFFLGLFFIFDNIFFFPLHLFIYFFLFLLLFSFLIIIYILDLHHHTRSWKAFICFGSRARRWRGRWARAPAGHARKSGLFSKKFVGALFCFFSSSFFSILIFLVLHILVVVYRQEYISFSSFFFFLITFYPVHPCRNL